MIKGVLLDIDGTLVDSNEAHALAWAEALREFGIDASLEKVRKKIGMGADQLLPEFGVFEPENPNFSKIARRESDIFRDKFIRGLKAHPGAKEMLERFQQKGLKCVAATSAAERDMDLLLEEVGLAGLIKNRVSSTEITYSKPRKDIILSALEKGSLKPEEALMIGDSPYDLMAAKKAGVESIAFTSGGYAENELPGALMIYSGPQDLLDKWKQSPFSAAKAA